MPEVQDNPTEGSLRIWWIPQLPMDEAFTAPVSSVAEGAKMLNLMAEYDAFRLLNKVNGDYANSGGLEIFEDGEWCDWIDHETFVDDPQTIHPQPSLGWCKQLNKLEA